MKITFLGGAGLVTGALYYVEHNDTRLLVDCGLAQGCSFCDEINYAPFDFDVSSIGALLVTHAHLDHIGRIPKLIRDGFSGVIYSTAPAKEEAHPLLLDAHHIMEMEHPADRMLYDVAHIDRAMDQWKTVHYRTPFSIGDVQIEYFNAGHILGSASVRLTWGDKSVVFSGDLGNTSAPLITATDYPPASDYALIESAYGNRTHEPLSQRAELLEDLIEDVVQRKGVLLIPAFALERTQQLLYELNDLVEGGRIPEVPIFIDSPLAIRLTSVYEKYSTDPEFFSADAITSIKKGDKIFNFPHLQFTLTTEESKHINSVPPPKVIIAGSGMSTGGRILHHEMRYLSDANSTILFVGFQAEGSLGRTVLDGADVVTIMGEKIPIRARVESIGGYSAHADQPLLLDWVAHMKSKLKTVFVVQGELDQSLPLASAIKDQFAIDAFVPDPGQVVDLG